MKVKNLFIQIQIDFPTLQNQIRDVEDLVSYHTGLSWSDLKIRSSYNLSDDEVERIWADMLRLSKGEPSAYIMKEKHFFKHVFKVGPGVLIPRPETEILVETALEIENPIQRMADLGAGSGCIGLSLAKEWPEVDCHLFEVSTQALAICRANQAKLDLNNVQCHQVEVTADQPEGFGPFDLIVANPPYIAKDDSRVEKSVHNFEPHRALYAEAGGLRCIEDWLQWAQDHLVENGHFIFEFGQGQESTIAELIDPNHFSIVSLIADYQSIPRFYHLAKTSQ